MPATTNKTKMQAAVARWIGEARRRADGPALLERKAAQVQRDLRTLSKLSAKSAELPEHLEGLTAFDLSGAHGELLTAAARIRTENKDRLARVLADLSTPRAA